MKKIFFITLQLFLVTFYSIGQSTSASNTLTGTLPTTPTQYLGSANAADVIFKSYNTERFRILSTGNIGFGTITPAAFFSVGTASQFRITNVGVVTTSGSITAAGITSTSGLSSSGTVAFSNLAAGKVVLTTTGGQLTYGTVSVPNGGTGATTLTGILQGNGTSAFTALIGTTNKVPRWSATTPYLTTTSSIWDDANYVGIGTIVPKVKFHLHSTEVKTGGGNSPQGAMGPTSTYNYAALQITNNSTTEAAETGLLLAQTDLSSGIFAKSGDLMIQSLGITNIIGTTINLSNVFHVFSNGNVGMGTFSTAAPSKLTIWDNSSNESQMIRLGASSVLDYKIFREKTTGTLTIQGTQNGSNNFSYKDDAGKVLFRILENGSVGVGTETPTARLNVKSDSTFTGLLVETSFDSTFHGYGIVSNVGANGDSTIAFAVKKDTTTNFIVFGNGHVQARDIIVKLGNLGDFVFDKDYNLMTIYDLEKYVKQNHHLPKVPSAAEVRENGMNIGEFQNLVLQKTEEQALYIISLQKQIDELKSIVQNLKK